MWTWNGKTEMITGILTKKSSIKLNLINLKSNYSSCYYKLNKKTRKYLFKIIFIIQHVIICFKNQEEIENKGTYCTVIQMFQARREGPVVRRRQVARCCPHLPCSTVFTLGKPPSS